MKSFVIYKHTNLINNKVYIGQTCQEPSRRRSHGEGYKDSPKFWTAIQKYGWENFAHEIIETNLTQEEANLREQYWIKFYNSFGGNGYNLTPGGDNYQAELWKDPEYKKRMRESFSKARKAMAEKQKKIVLDKMAEATKALWQDEEWREKRIQKIMGDKNPNAKPVRNIETGIIFSTIKEAAEWSGLKAVSGIGQCCRKERKTSGRHPETGEPLHWEYVDKREVMEE